MWIYQIKQDIKSSETVILDHLSAFLIGRDEISLRISGSQNPAWYYLLPDETKKLPPSIMQLGERIDSLPGFSPKFWITRSLIKEDRAVRISGVKIESLLDLPIEELIQTHQAFTLNIRLCSSKNIPYCKEGTLLSVEISTDNENIGKIFAQWVSGRIKTEPRSTFIYSSELPYFFRPPISTYTFSTQGTLSPINSINRIFVEDPNLLTKHCLICGQPGSGKTNSAKNILDQLLLGQKFSGQLLILDNKGEYRSWANKHHINYYEVGKHPEALKLLQINPFIPGGNVKLINHLEVLATILSVSGFTGAGVILPEYMKLVLFAFFGYLWNKDEGSIFQLLNMTGHELITAGFPFHGKNGETIPAALHDFWKKHAKDHFDRWVGNATGRNLSDIQGILSVRINSLIYSPLNYFSYAPSSASADHLLNKSYVLSFKGSSDNHLVLLVSLLVFLYCQSARVLDETAELNNLLLIEEAHMIMKKSPESAEVVTAESLLGRIFDRMLAELRSQGVGLLLIDQSPSQLILNVIANTSTKILHRLSFPVDIEVMCNSLGIQEQDEVRYLDSGFCFYKIEAKQPQKEYIPLWKAS